MSDKACVIAAIVIVIVLFIIVLSVPLGSPDWTPGRGL